MKTSFADARKKAEAEGLLGGGGFFKLQEGDNRIRLMSECLPHNSEFNGKSNFKWLCYVIDRSAGKLKPFFMAHRIYKAIEALQMNPDYSFEDVPMPYDLTIHAKKAGTMDVEYTVFPARKETPITALEQQELTAAKPLADIKQALKDKQQQKKAAAPPTEDPSDSGEPVDVDSIPF